MSAAPESPAAGRRQNRALTDIGPRKPTRRASLRHAPAGHRFHAVSSRGRELLIFGNCDGVPFYREFRVGHPAAHGPAGSPPGTVAEFAGSFVRVSDEATGELHRLDLYQFIRLNWRHPDGGDAP